MATTKVAAVECREILGKDFEPMLGDFRVVGVFRGRFTDKQIEDITKAGYSIGASWGWECGCPLYQILEPIGLQL